MLFFIEILLTQPGHAMVADQDSTNDHSVVTSTNGSTSLDPLSVIQDPSGSAKQKDNSPKYVPGEVLVKIKEGADPSVVLQEAGINPKSLDRIHPIKAASAKFKKDYKLQKSSDGWYSFLGKQYKEVNEISDEMMFGEAYKAMPETERSLYRKFKIALPDEMSAEEAVSRLKNNQAVESINLNYIRSASVIPNDPRYNDQYLLYKLNIAGAWDLFAKNQRPGFDFAGEGIVVAIVDTGIDYNHEDLSANIWINRAEDINGNGRFENWPVSEARNGLAGDMDGIDNDGNGYVDDVAGYDFVTVFNDPKYVAQGEDPGPADNNPMDTQGHGTHLSGIVAGVANNGIGIAGIAPRSKIMAVRAGYKGTDGGGYLRDSDIQQAILYATQNGARVINMSFGGTALGSWEDEIKYANSQSVVMIAAAGNNNSLTKSYPAAMDEVIAVSSVNNSNHRSIFSNYGPWVEMAAPGEYVVSTLPNNQYGEKSGTSMSSPCVAAVAALVLSRNPALTSQEVRNILDNSTTDISQDGRDCESGFGLVNPWKALTDMDKASYPLAIISSPINYGIVNNTTYEIRGSAKGNGFHHYDIDMGLSKNGDLPQNFLPIVSHVATEKTDQTLAQFNTTDFLHDIGSTLQCLRLSVYDTMGKVQRFTVPITIDPTLLPGWPVRDESVGYCSSILADINQDGMDEIIYTTTNYLFVYKSDGTLLWQKYVNGSQFGREPAVGDLDPNFPGLELAIGVDAWAGYEIYAFHCDGSAVNGWPVTKGQYTIAPMIADFDGDTHEEVFFVLGAYSSPVDTKAVLYLHRGNSTTVTGWPILLKDYVMGGAIADIDGDGRNDVLLVCSDHSSSSIRVYNYNGVEISWALIELPKYIYNSTYKPMVVGDLEADGNVEVAGSTIDGRVYVWTYDRQAKTVTLLPGWPKIVGSGTSELQLSLADLDYDGILEIVCTGYNLSDVYVWRKDGSDYTGFPKAWRQSNLPVIIGDIDGDDESELLHTKAYYGTYAYKLDGQPVQGFPKFEATYSWNILRAPALGDVNGDGMLELVAGNWTKKEIALYQLGKKGDLEWPMPHHDAQNSNNYNFRRGLPPDHTRPTTPLVNDEGIVTLNNDRLTASWISSDPESGISGHVYAIGTSRDSSDVKKWTFTENNTSITVTGLSLRLGATYYFSVRAKNGVGMIGDKGSSDGITYSLNKPPDLSNIPSFLTKDEGGAIAKTDIELATDPEGGALTYTYSGWFNSLPYKIGYDQSGQHTLHMDVSDGVNTAGKDISITVNNINNPPIIQPIANQNVNVDVPIVFNVLADDPNNDPLIYKVYPAGDVNRDGIVTASDVLLVIGLFGSTKDSVSWNPSSDLDNNGVINTADYQNVVGQINLGKTRLPFNPDDPLVLNPTTGAFSWKPTTTNLGENLFTFVASDGQVVDARTVTITVINVFQPPTALSAVNTGVRSITLRWKDNSSNETGFKIERSTDGVNFTQIGTVGANIISYSNTGLAEATTYYYRVCAYDGGGNSSYSNTISAATLLPAPYPLMANIAYPSSINLSWTDSSSSETGFKVEMARSLSGPFSVIGTTLANVKTFTHTTAGRTCGYYFYRVRAFKGSNIYSAYSGTTYVLVTLAAPTKPIVAVISSTQINLRWTNTSTFVSGFKIERSLNPTSGFTQIATVGPKFTAFKNTRLLRNTRYYYRLRAYNGLNNSEYSGTAMGQTSL